MTGPPAAPVIGKTPTNSSANTGPGADGFTGMTGWVGTLLPSPPLEWWFMQLAAQRPEWITGQRSAYYKPEDDYVYKFEDPWLTERMARIQLQIKDIKWELDNRILQPWERQQLESELFRLRAVRRNLPGSAVAQSIQKFNEEHPVASRIVAPVAAVGVAAPLAFPALSTGAAAAVLAKAKLRAAEKARKAVEGAAKRPFAELIKDAGANPSKWQVVKKEVVSSTNIRNKGGTSVQEILRNPETGEEIVRHTLFKPDGTVFEPPHFRPFSK